MKRLAVFLLFVAWAAIAQPQTSIIEFLKNADWRARLTKEQAPALIWALENPEVRTKAAIGLRILDSAGLDLRTTPEQGLGVELRQRAVKALQQFAKATNDKEAIWSMAVLLRNREFGHHGDAWSDPNEVQPIVELGKAATPALLELLDFSDDKDRSIYGAKFAALHALRAIKDPAAADRLLAFIRTEDGAFFHSVFAALNELDDPRTARVLIKSIDGQYLDYGWHASTGALVQMGGRAVPALLEALKEKPSEKVATDIVFALGQIRDQRAIPALAELVRGPDIELTWRAAMALSEIPLPANKAVLLSLLSNELGPIRTFGVIGLGRLGDPDTFDQVAALLKDESAATGEVLKALAKIGRRKAIPLAVPYLSDHALQRAVIDALRPLQPGKIWEKELIKVLRSGPEEARREAAEILGGMKSVAAVPNLMLVMQYDSYFPRLAAAEALGRIGKPSVEPLLKLLPKAKGDMLHAVLQALAGTGDPRGFEIAVPYLQNKEARRSVIKGLGLSGNPEAIRHIMPFAKDSDEGLRCDVYEALGNLKAVDAVPRLIWALDYDRTSFLGAHGRAAEALGKIGDRRAYEPLLRVAQDGRVYWRTIEALAGFPEPRTVELLIKLLEGDSFVNSAAARALGRIGDPSALPALEKAAASGEQVLSDAAKEAIYKIRERGIR